MIRRKWWLIALSLALLAACVGGWKWSGKAETPPFRFLVAARQLSFDVGPASLTDGWVEISYWSDIPPDELQTRAYDELEERGFFFHSHFNQPEERDYMWWHFPKGSRDEDVTVEIDEPRVAGARVPAAAKAVVVITYSRNATVQERLRAWLLGIGGKVASP
jgi:hypothetical protein